MVEDQMRSLLPYMNITVATVDDEYDIIKKLDPDLIFLLASLLLRLISLTSFNTHARSVSAWFQHKNENQHENSNKHEQSFDNDTIMFLLR
mmetsp:Transcript_13741/g.20852  ORF Transcript_13741/g.20852 Transcript_13741/m.20852 type:complete len:91 (+) Transcript_13741:1325-1597(+)